ncbi:MAG TPA: sulfatase-like hydrolase/transferase [Anaerolineae bacterium]|nr:sulfatase-like hydrolase/transferase [Anaerolineae bacterium]
MTLPDPKPNIIVFMTDDQGHGDLSCMGNTDFRTPHLDDLAASSVCFTSWYANSPVCSPSRASLLTGRYPGNAGVRSILAGHRTASGLPGRVPTPATALRALGYRTAMFGKWHLGLMPGSRPEDHGFDEWFGFMAGCIDYYSHIFYWGMNRGGPGNDPTHDLWQDGMDLFPTFLRLAGGEPGAYEVDGIDLMPAMARGATLPERDIYWEMGVQTAVRRGPWKLVLNGQLVEGAPPEDDVHLTNLDQDVAERHNLKDEHPELTAELTRAAQHWCDGIEDGWRREWEPKMTGTTTHPSKQAGVRAIRHRRGEWCDDSHQIDPARASARD